MQTAKHLFAREMADKCFAFRRQTSKGFVVLFFYVCRPPWQMANGRIPVLLYQSEAFSISDKENNFLMTNSIDTLASLNNEHSCDRYSKCSLGCLSPA